MLIAQSEEDLVEMANASPYGLGASIWTRVRSEGKESPESWRLVLSPSTTWLNPIRGFLSGGSKNPGIGRELSEYGLKEFVNIKSVVVKGRNSMRRLRSYL